MIILVLFLLIAAFWDLWKKKIPNKLIILGFVLGVGWNLITNNLMQLPECLPGIILPVVLLFPLFQIGAMGAGDLKLFSLTGFFLPLWEVLGCMLTAFFFGAIYSLLLLLWKKILITRIRYFFSYLFSCYFSGGFSAYYPSGEEGEQMKRETGISFAVPIFLSILLSWKGVI